MSCCSVLCRFLRFHVWTMIKLFFFVAFPSCIRSCLCFWLPDFQVGIMHVRRHLTCSCGRSCRCAWLTLWERSICCLTSSSVNLQSNWCRNGEYKWVWIGVHACFIEACPELCRISPQVHAKFFRTSRVWEQEARRPTCPEWVSRTCVFFFLLFVRHLDCMPCNSLKNKSIIFSCEVNSG